MIQDVLNQAPSIDLKHPSDYDNLEAPYFTIIQLWHDWMINSLWPSDAIYGSGHGTVLLPGHFCYQLIANPGNKAAAVSWPDPYVDSKPVPDPVLTYQQWDSVSFSFTGSIWYTNTWNEFENTFVKSFPRLSGVKELNWWWPSPWRFCPMCGIFSLVYFI